jgi:hypothetical protein
MRKSRPEPNTPVFIYRSTFLHEADLVANEFERAGIACYRAVEDPIGVRWAMPLSAAWEPGCCFLVVVPGPQSKRARRVVAGLPVSHEESPGVWQPWMRDEDKALWRTWAWLSLAGVLIALVAAVVSALRN